MPAKAKQQPHADAHTRQVAHNGSGQRYPAGNEVAPASSYVALGS